MKKKVVIGMSGGVDSSVAAYLLKEQGYDVIGVTLRMSPSAPNHEDDEWVCSSLSAVEDARKVANKLEIPFYVINFEEIFKTQVIDYFIDEYMQGRTPNPCIACNKFIKFDALIKKAMELGADYVATGHYATIEKIEDRHVIRKSEDDKKDQTYVLYNLTQFQLEHVLMPCGAYKKEEIREIARKLGLNVANKKDSLEICFIPDNDHGNFIKKNVGSRIREGNFVDKKGNVLGRHKGIVNYTIGQRKGLGIAFGTPMYVIDINPFTNEVVLGSEEDIFKTDLIIKDVNFLPFEKLEESKKVQAKVRYSAKGSDAMILPLEDGRVKVEFENKQRAITKGQSCVFYDGDVLVGGGVIDEVI